MDVKCKWCGEPWDVDTMHDVAETLDTSFTAVRQLFYKFGCAAIESGWDGVVPTTQTCVVVEEMTDEQKNRKAALDVMQELSGDDIDGLAADTEDFEHMGWL